MASIPVALLQKLRDYSQTHLLNFWDSLSESQQQQLVQQIESIDFERLVQCWKASIHPAMPEGEDRAEKARSPRNVIRQPATAAERKLWSDAHLLGVRELEAGKVAVITVAGGQGTRLGFDHPKGMFPIGPVSDRSLFQIFAEQILARRRRHQAQIPWLIMTSDATHAETVEFFQAHSCFGLDPKTVHFFQQGSLPALDAQTGQILMIAPDQLALSPDGHGGLVQALSHSGLLEKMKQLGVAHFFYHQVDNPTVIMADPALIGFHLLHGSQLTTNVVCKTSPTERMGVLVDLDGQTQIIEYSELTAEQAARKDVAGQWIFWAGNTAIHLFRRDFLEHLASDGGQLPLHVARKNVAFLDDHGQLQQPSDPAKPNGIKLERFIFDALPLAQQTLIVEGNRAREFNPVKNKSGNDSAETSRAALIRIADDWLRDAGISPDPGTAVEVSPLDALDSEELADKLKRGILKFTKNKITAD
ncbi:MAG: UDPGP type 1 family protein [Planctomycetaceae bacterium]